MLKAGGIDFSLSGRGILHSAGIEAARGEVVALVGPNGAGKTTLLRCILGMVRFQAGKVSVDGRDCASMTARERARHMGYVPQASPSRFAVTVFDMVLMGRRPFLGWRPSRRDRESVASALEDMGLAHLADRDFDCLSGGQRQKAVLARVFVQEPEFLLLDEPTSQLDLRCRLEVMDHLRQAAESGGVGVVAAVHDLNLARRYADRVVLLDQGAVAASGPPEEVLTPEAIREVYEVDVALVGDDGLRLICPLRPASGGNPGRVLVSEDGG